MKPSLRPQEYYYLYSPMRSDPIEMIKYTFQGLIVDGHLELYTKYILINKNEKYKRKRLFFKIGPNYKASNTYSKAETLVLKQFTESDLRIHQIRDELVAEIGKKVETYKYNYVYKDIHALGLSYFSFLLNGKGRRERKACENLMEDIDKNIDTLLKDEKTLNQKIDELGANIIFLEKETLDKLNKYVNPLSDFNTFFAFDPNNDKRIAYGYSFGNSRYGIGYGGGGFGGVGGGGGFGGNGGGMSGSGGSGGSW